MCDCHDFVGEKFGECIKHIQESHPDIKASDYDAFVVVMQYAITIANGSFEVNLVDVLSDILIVFPEFLGIKQLQRRKEEKETIH